MALGSGVSTLVLLGALFTYKIIFLCRYVLVARKTGLPYTITPLLETETIAQLLTPLLRAIYFKQLDKGKGWPHWCRFWIKDWSWEDKRFAHEEYGDVFLLVSPEGIICYCADADMGWDVMNRRYDFTKPRDKYKLLEPYGPNVATAEGSVYRFHVRITAPPFSDGSGVNELVWSETMSQTSSLMDKWEQTPPKNLHDDVNALTLAVIALAGFGRDVGSATEQEKSVPTGYQISFLRAIADTTKYMVAILVFPSWLLRWSPLAKADLARWQLDKYLRHMIRHERQGVEEGGASSITTAATNKTTATSNKARTGSARGNLLQSVMRASFEEAQQQQKVASMSNGHGFSEDEVMGNLFIYLLAGYETTANAIAYGLIALALHPDIQRRVTSEVDSVWREAAAAGRSQPTYGDDFSRLEYLYGFMYETLRLYPGVTLITKMCKEAQTVTSRGKSYVLPAGCRVYLSAPGVHYHDEYWPEPWALRPERWTEDEGSAVPAWREASKSNVSAAKAADKSRQMHGRLLTFSDGARACLGRKFAQAEYMAFFAALLRQYEVRLAPGQDPAETKRALDMTCAGAVTLAPAPGFRLQVVRRQ